MKSTVSYDAVSTPGVAVLTVCSGPVNALSGKVFSDMGDALSRAINDPTVKAIVICGSGSTFPAGADIKEFPTLRQAIIQGKPVDLNVVPNAIERSPKLVVAAIHGTALGGGLELALACHMRVALSSAKFGLPEVQLGLCPGAGGTQRLPRLIGVPDAMQMIVTGAMLPAPVAFKKGLIDRIVPGKSLAELLASAVVIAAKSQIDVSTRRISLWPCVPTMPQSVFDGTRKMVAQSARGYVAPQACIDAVEAAATLPFVEGIQVESQIFKKLLEGPQSRAQQYVFFSQRRTSAVPGLNLNAAQKINKVGIIGAGTMGGGVAVCFIEVGIPVVLIETQQEFLDRGMATIRSNYDSAVKRRRLKPEAVKKYMSLITPSLDYAALSDVDLVIEAVFEDMEVKKSVLAKLDKACKPSCVLCTNTSTLSIDEIASATSRPQSVVGAHFFSPANKMKLLENVRGAKSSETAIATVMAMGKLIKKVPVLVGNCFGFVGNRMVEPYGREAAYLVEEGCSVAQVDSVIFKFGMAIGPFTMSDLAGNDIGLKIRKSLGLLDPNTRPRNERYHGGLGDRLCKAGRLGMKTGKGWYDYGPGRKATASKEVAAIIDNYRNEIGYAQKQRKIDDQEVLERILYPLINTGFQCLEEGIASRPSDIDIIYIYGYGWPAYRGGPMYYADEIGLDVLLAGLTKYAAIHKNVSHWKPSALLQQLVRQKTSLAQYWANKSKAARKSKL
uniref:Uncharacterized protein n=1 Tax=Spongospora subterranea TaxID=70186 RepID=A0A0H5QLN1_9EUKA|eukprot:CRZ02261.1 hypothetical protein [Spongospora subterranea]